MNIHFCGIGGIGMSALARYCLSLGFSVSGSDSSDSDLTYELKQEGVLWVNDKEVFSDQADIFIYSEAISEDDIQRKYAKENGIESFSYFQYLGEISKNHKTIAVCGTHGKSTTTAMLGIALMRACINPLVIVGTKVKEFSGKNVCLPLKNKNSKGHDIFVVEACEYRASFLSLHPFAVILTNCEHDHMDYYKTEKDYKEEFKKFVKKIPKEGFLVANFDDKNVKEVAQSAVCRVIPIYFSQLESPICPKVPGWHNQLNAQVAYEAGMAIVDSESIKSVRSKSRKVEKPTSSLRDGESLMGMDPCLRGDDRNEYAQKILRESLEQFSGTWRRFDILGEKGGITVIDDYAHHPTAISVTLQALEEFSKGRRIILVFQPHQYSRTRELFHEFVDSFASSSFIKRELGGGDNSIKILITDIYEARDTQEDKASVSSEILVEAIKKKGGNAEYSGDYKNTQKKLKTMLQKNDVLVTMGAGPINLIAEEFLKS
ncbi:hypothetical protein HON22_04085 [Candidatus Peregrinibacteria bacterium]|jgi:UDP-N-acetylmuramate--alanine ligase|nr:hypothetical protein [Candidatus Peregrinibacteria bacterium]